MEDLFIKKWRVLWEVGIGVLGDVLRSLSSKKKCNVMLIFIQFNGKGKIWNGDCVIIGMKFGNVKMGIIMFLFFIDVIVF